MNTGQKLVELSGLSSGSALAHLLAITQGTGTGVDRIVFASSMVVSVEAPQITLLRKPGVQSGPSPASDAPVSTRCDPLKKRIDVMPRTPQLFVTTAQDSIFIVQRRQHARVVMSLPNVLSVRRQRTAVSI